MMLPFSSVPRIGLLLLFSLLVVVLVLLLLLDPSVVFSCGERVSCNIRSRIKLRHDVDDSSVYLLDEVTGIILLIVLLSLLMFC
jgi:hypothetical protein